jgi:hypothetical protein
MRRVISLFDSEHIETLGSMCVIERIPCAEPAKLRDVNPPGYAMQTVLGTFGDRRTAQRAVDELIARGFTRASVHLQTGASPDRPEREAATDRGMMARAGSFFSKLFESDAKDHLGNDAEAVRRGGSVVAVDTSDDSEVQKAEAIMGQLGTINVDDRAEQWEGEGWSGFDPNNQPGRDEPARSGDPSAPGLSGSDPASRKS